MLTDLKKMIVRPDATLREVMGAIDSGALQIALVTDADGILVATVTDGDVRRGILRGLPIDARVTEVMHGNPTTLPEGVRAASVQRLMRERCLHHIPIVDPHGRPVALALREGLTEVEPRTTHLVLMAGGLGTRLRPLTETVPKPMLQVGGKPILELIVQNSIRQGYNRFTMALNYRGEMIRDYFGDGSKFGAEISYVEETKKMGTAGALSLLETRPAEPFIVMNGDLLTSTPFDALMGFHAETGAVGTMCARDYPMQVPYGVIEVEDATLCRIVEKPTYSFFVNAGIYVLSPEVLDFVAPDAFLDMPDLFDRIVASGAQASVFPIQEYWLDIGRHEDLERARMEIGQLFSDLGDEA